MPLAGLVVGHVSLPVVFEDTDSGEVLQFALQTGGRHPHATGQLGNVPCLFELPEQCCQNSLTGLREQGIEKTNVSNISQIT